MGARASCVTGAVLLAACLGSAQVAPAGVVAFNINSATSSLRMTGTYNTNDGLFPLQEIVAGNMLTRVGGTILMEVGTTPFGFRGGDIFATVNPTIPAGFQPANFQFQSSLPPPQGIVNGLVRDFHFKIEGDPIPLANGFEMSSTQIHATDGDIISDFAPTIDLTGQLATGVSGSATVGAPLGEHLPPRTLQIPFTMTFEVAVPLGEYIMNLAFSGTVFASGEVPEPASGMVLLAGAVIAVGRRRSR